MVPNQPLNGNTVGGSASFKARPGHIVLPDRRRRMEFAGGCQKVSSLCERTDPLFTALYRAQAPFVLLLPSLCTASFFSLRCSGSAPEGFTLKWVSEWGAMAPPHQYPTPVSLARNTRGAGTYSDLLITTTTTLPHTTHPSSPPLPKEEPLNDMAQK